MDEGTENRNPSNPAKKECSHEKKNVAYNFYYSHDQHPKGRHISSSF